MCKLLVIHTTLVVRKASSLSIGPAVSNLAIVVERAIVEGLIVCRVNAE